jgi:hypothetical protein
MQHFSDCDGSAIFRISSNNLSIWTNPYQHPMQFDLFQTSSKFWPTWVGVHVLRVLSNIAQKGGVHVLRVLSKITQTSGRPILVLGVAFSYHSHLAHISLPSHSPLTFDMWLCGARFRPSTGWWEQYTCFIRIHNTRNILQLGCIWGVWCFRLEHPKHPTRWPACI